MTALKVTWRDGRWVVETRIDGQCTFKAGFASRDSACDAAVAWSKAHDDCDVFAEEEGSNESHRIYPVRPYSYERGN